MSDVTWTNGFWADRFKVCRETMIPNLWKIYSDPKMGHAIQNFEIAAGLDTGSHGGAPFQDGDFYKLFEAAAAIYASTHDSKIDKLMDQTIALIAKAQRADGYINTQTLIDERNRPKEGKAFEDRMNFENGWENNLYREVSTKNDGSAYIRLIPYYAWDNRGHNNMETWIPFDR
ncbi:MAG TPA: beta-L-arabinofuranosidase domain-containing protein [Mucilaginibacter sp.]